MALVRCETHGRPTRTTKRYSVAAKPLGYPRTAAICGRQGCENAGLVWLTEDEDKEYRRGQRVFSLPSATVKIQVE
jgi:hypothetical protein